jgi:hypothetical protein
MRIISSALGIPFLLLGTVGCLMLAGHSPSSWFFLPPVLAMLLIPVGCCTIAFGAHAPFVVVRSFALLWSPRQIPAPKAPRILSAFIGYIYGAGVFVFLAGLVSILSCITDSGFTVGFRENVKATIVSLIYAVVMAEVVIRPLKHRLSCENL